MAPMSTVTPQMRFYFCSAQANLVAWFPNRLGLVGWQTYTAILIQKSTLDS
jgi:hypothetical protein